MNTKYEVLATDIIGNRYTMEFNTEEECVIWAV